MEVGDLIWMSRSPGGVCILLGKGLDTDMNEVLFKVLHPIEGYVEDPAYYFMTIERCYELAARQKKMATEE